MLRPGQASCQAPRQQPAHNTVVSSEDLLVEGDKVVARWTCRGTHQGVFRGMAPTGKRVTFTGMTLYRMAQGKIVEQWTEEDGVSLCQQLGFLSA